MAGIFMPHSMSFVSVTTEGTGDEQSVKTSAAKTAQMIGSLMTFFIGKAPATITGLKIY